MKNLIDYLEDNNIQYSDVTEDLITLPIGVCCIVEPEEGVLIDSDFTLPRGNADSDYKLFRFGGNWYYSSTSSKKAKLTPLKYIGESRVDFVPTKTFLGVHGGFEILNGSGQYKDWANKAKFLGVRHLGICEKNTLAGVVKFQNSCLKQGITPIIGATYTVHRKSSDFQYDIKLFVKNEQGWDNLLSINKEVNVVNQKFIYEDDFFKYKEGLVIILDPKTFDYKNIFPYDLEDFYYQLDLVEFEDEERDNEYLTNLKLFLGSNGTPIPMCDAYYLDKEDYEIKSKLNSISGAYEYKSNNQYFKSKDDYFEELGAFIKDDVRFANMVTRLLATEDILVGLCRFNIPTGERHLPKYVMTPEEAEIYETNTDLFWGLIQQGLSRIKFDDDDKLAEYLDRVEEEVRVIEFGGVVDYFLTLYDIISWCKKNDILVGIGRGSAGGSLVSFLLGLIHLNPLEFDLLFSRFLNEGRVVKSYPDIDTDIESLRRNDVKHYMEERFGHSQVISIGTYTALQLKAAIKDLSRVYGLSFDEVNDVTKLIENEHTFEELFERAVKTPTIRDFIINNPELINDIPLIIGQPKAKSVHACAMVIFPDGKDMFHWAPICKQDDLYVSEWEGSEIEQVGFLKEDILGIKQLDKFRNIKNLVKIQLREDIDIYSIPYDDEAVLSYFRKGYNGDCFHFGSVGLTKYCKELLPENLEDLIAGISLYRPGAIENNFHNEYVLRKHGERLVEYSVGTEPILNKTYGVFVYQEQIMKLCQVLGGLSLVEADDVRKAMVKKKFEELTKYKERFLPYYIENFRVTPEYAQEVWDQIDKASTYLFNRCISGDEKLKAIGVPYKYTIGQMWKMKNVKGFCKTLGLSEGNISWLYQYGYSYSLNSENRLVKNRIKDIRYVGIKPIYRMELSNGATIDVTSNHKFPTSNGEKMLSDIVIGEDKIFYNVGGLWDELYTELLDIKSIEYLKDDEVYDVEMFDPMHTFVTSNNIVTSNSHAAAYAITGYISQWLKVHYPIQYWTTAFEFMSQDEVNKGKIPMYLSEINKTGAINISSVDINKSKLAIGSDFYTNTIYWSISAVKQVGEIAANQIIEERNTNGKYFSFEEFISRHSQKGSKVNKAHIENLIISGAFDSIENIKQPLQRIELIKQYRKIKKIKVGEDDKFSVTNPDIYNNWWWGLQQKKLSGIALFDYQTICNEMIPDCHYLEQDLYQSKNLIEHKYYSLGGYVIDVRERNSKNKGKYCTITIESNYEFLTISIFPDMYRTITDTGIDLLNSIGRLIIVSGMIRHDDWRKEQVLKVWDNSSLHLLGN